jgi:peroxiredoxin (alkyl hydroperoxide reductase subunit C)
MALQPPNPPHTMSETPISRPISQMHAPIRLGDLAPDFAARSTRGEVKLSAFRGQWLIFFSHPADFTPVCTTEFVSLARRQADFEALDCALLGLSVDSLYAHLAWVRAIEAQFGVAIEFPIIEDPSMAVGRAFGMIDDSSIDAMAMRSAFFIDPDGIVRAITCYPHNVGRSVDEMLRMLSALKAVEDGKGLAPEGWRPGAPLLNPPPDQCGDIGREPDWFCRLKS